MVCEIPYEILDDLSGKMPKLRQQIMRLMSSEIKGDQEMILLLSKRMLKNVLRLSFTTYQHVSRNVVLALESSV